ncbi:MAG TPA: pilin [Thermodesulfobacteriota bacterium]|nr:pilin [Thermodesulfobacteriota bacterium]
MEERSAILPAVALHGSIPEPGSAPRRAGGFTLVELLIAVAILGIIATIAIPSYQEYIEKAKETAAITDINVISLKLKAIMAENPDALPPDLSFFVDILPLVDPWGNPYQYLPIYGHLGDHGYMNGARKDHNLHPINSDFDLYSMGPDGQSVKPLTGGQSRDDIIRANDGAFIGKASTYDPG